MNDKVPSIGDNSKGVVQDLKSQLKKLGQLSIASDLARPQMAIAIVSAVTDGIPGSDDAAACYGTYMEGRAAAQGKNKLAQGIEPGGGEKANISKLKQIIDMARLPIWDTQTNGTHLLDRVVTLRGNLLGTEQKIKAPYDAFVDVSRAQLKQPDEVLSDEAINGCLIKPEPASKSELDKLIDAYKKTSKLAEAMPLNKPLGEAVSNLGDAIVEAGGEIPPMTKEEKKMADAAAFLASMGIQIVRPASPQNVADADEAEQADEQTDAAA